MRIPFVEFEKFIDGPVRKRGLTYFNQGHVTECDEITDGTYEAVVAGTEDYTVRVNLDGEMITDYLCDCPYDMGPVCKHIAAVCFWLRQGRLDIKKTNTRSAGQNKPRKRKTIADQVNELLEKITHDELRQFIREVAERDRPFRETFLSSFAMRDEGESREFYIKRVKSILRSASDRHGFVGWHASGKVGADIYRLLDAAKKRVEQQNYMSAVYVCTAVMEQMTEALQYADDSNGDIGGCVDYAFDILADTADLALPEEDRIYLIDYCFTAFDKKIYEGWDWHTNVLQLASLLLKNEKELQLLIARTETSGLTDYELEFTESITYHALLKIRGEKEAEKYLELHIGNPNLRRKSIENALNEKQFEHACLLARNGIEQDHMKKPGLAMEWYDWLLRIAQAQKNRGDIIQYARLLFIDSFRHEQNYYEVMKKHVPAKEWTNFVEMLIVDVANKARGYPAGIIAEIYVREAWWDRLMEMIKTSPSLASLEKYETYLKKDYSNELAGLYADAVIGFVSNSTGRQDYKTAARYIRRIKKLGATEKAARTIETLRVKYPRRPALMEELDMV